MALASEQCFGMDGLVLAWMRKISSSKKNIYFF